MFVEICLFFLLSLSLLFCLFLLLSLIFCETKKEIHSSVVGGHRINSAQALKESRFVDRRDFSSSITQLGPTVAYVKKTLD